MFDCKKEPGRPLRAGLCAPSPRRAAGFPLLSLTVSRCWFFTVPAQRKADACPRHFFLQTGQKAAKMGLRAGRYEHIMPALPVQAPGGTYCSPRPARTPFICFLFTGSPEKNITGSRPKRKEQTKFLTINTKCYATSNRKAHRRCHSKNP